MAGELEKSLETLRHCLTENSQKYFSDAFYSIQNISSYFEQELNKQELDYAFSTVFAERNGLLKFLQVAFPLKNFKNAILESFVLLKYLVYHFQERVAPYILSIKATCETCLSQFDTSAYEKERALEVLREILQKGSWGQDLELKKLIVQLLQQACQPKQSPKVLQQLYHTLGTIARRYPEHMLPSAAKLLRLYCSELDKQIRFENSRSLIVVTGCLEGLVEYMYTFPPNPEDNANACKKIYTYMKTFTIDSAHRKIAPRAALKLLQWHGSLFATQLFSEYKWWHEELLPWLKLAWEDRKIGLAALHTFYREVANFVQENTNDESVLVLKYFIDFFRRKMLSQSTHPHELGEVIKGFGLFAGPCLKHMKREDVQYMFTLVMQSAEHVYLNFSFKQVEDQPQKNLQNLPDYVESIGSIIVQLGEVTTDQFTSLQYMAVFLVQNFARVPVKFHYATINAFTTLFYSLARSKGILFEDFINVLVYQGIVRTCSHPVAIDVELQKDQLNSNSKQITYKNYIALWLAILSIKSYEKKGMPLTMKQAIVTKLYNVWIQTVMLLMNKLDLSTSRKTGDSSGQEFDADTGLQATTPKDFQVFINLVDVCLDVLPNVDCHMFEKWVQPFSYQVILESASKPLVSGYYKLMTVTLQLCEKLQYFNVTATEDLRAEREACSQLVCHFLQQMVGRVGHYKGDLQIACLQTFLATPVSLVPQLLHASAEAFQIIFRAGRSYLHLAELGLTALETWTSSLPLEDMQPLLKNILCHLDPFLQSKGVQGVADLELQFLQDDQSEKSRRRRRCLIRKNMTERPETELSQLQRRMLCYLGRLESTTCLALLQHQQDDSVPLGHSKKLKLQLPFSDMKPTIYLDELLPRIVELALSSSDRQIRVAACELLHAIVMFMLGTSVQLAAVDNLELSDVFSQLALPLLQLGCDPDQVVCQLFHPLVLQLTHWYSSRYQLRSRNAAIMMETLLDGITHPTDKAVRDVSAECLKEFVVWSIKQLPPSERDDSPINIKYILRKVFSFCLHPSSSKRLGAALAFNCLYSVVREEEAILDEFWLQLLYHFVHNLSLSENSDITDVVEAVNHVERGLRVKAELFNKVSKKRRMPPSFSGVLLRDAVVWLLWQCGSCQVECRHKCMQLVCSLAPLISGCNSTTTFITSVMNTEGREILLQICNGSSSQLCIAEDKQTLDEPSNWLQRLLASLDCYVWLIGEGLVQLDFLAEPGTRVFEVAALYVSRAVGSKDKLLDQLSPWEASTYNELKCSVTVRLFDFLSVVLLKAEGKVLKFIPDSFFTEQLWVLVASCLFRPQNIGFDMRSGSVNQELPATMEKLLVALKAGLSSSPHLENLYTVLTQHFDDLERLLGELQSVLQSDKVSDDQIRALEGLGVLHRSKVLADLKQEARLSGKQIVEAVLSSVTDSSKEVVFILQPASHAFGETLLKLAFLLDKQVSSLLNYLHSNTKLRNPGLQSEILIGEHFLMTFRNRVMAHLLQFPHETLDDLLGRENLQSLTVLEQLLLYMEENRKQCAHLAQEVATMVLVRWSSMVKLGEAPRLLGLLAQVAGCHQQPVGCLTVHSTVADWVLAQIASTELPLDRKSHALDLLPCVTCPGEDSNSALKTSLQALREQHFPQHSSELTAGSLQRDSFVVAFRKLLLSLELSGSLVILRSLVASAACDDKHLCEDDIQKTLPTFIKRLDSSCQMKAILATLDVFMADTDFDPRVRLGCVLRFTVPLVQACNSTVVQQFFTNCMPRLLDIIDCRLDGTRALRTEQQLVSRIGAWTLLELLFSRLVKEDLESMKVQSGKELIAELTRKAFSSRSESLPLKASESASLVELFRQVRCSAYKTLVAIICNTKRELKFYTGLLFTENKDKNQLLWETLVDCNKAYTFPIDWDEIPSRRKQLVNIRQSVRAEGQLQPSYVLTDTQYLFNSSLAEDLTKFDFTTSIVRSCTFRDSNPMYLSESFHNQAPNIEVTLEVDSINEHECMATLCGVIYHMVDSGISPLPKEGDDPVLPPWMVNLKKCLQDNTKHHNIRLFIVKLILNMEKVFLPYAKFWLLPLLQVIVDGCFGQDINYMVTDVLSMVMSWKSIPSSSDTEKLIASQVLNFLMANASNDRRDILKHNLEVIQTLVEVWKPCLNIPYQLLLDKLIHRAKEVGIQLVGIVLANGIQPWNNMGKGSITATLLSHLGSSDRTVYLPCAEVVGMVLKHMDPHFTGELTEGNDAAFLDSVHKKLNGQKLKQMDSFLICLHGIHKHYEPIVDGFMAIVLSQIPKSHGKFQTLCLELVMARLEQMGETAYVELTCKGLVDFLGNRDAGNQQLALLMVKKMAPTLQPPQLQGLLDVVCQLAGLSNVSCRSAMYDVLMWAYDEHRLGEGGKGTLLEGLVDSDPGLQNIVFQFWSDKKRLPTETANRLVHLLEHLYSACTEQHFLGYSMRLMLEATTLSPDYNRKMFEYPLSECKFEVLKVLTSWRARHTSYAPMFADTLASQVSRMDSLSDTGPAQLRTTQASLAFQPTIDLETAGPSSSVPSSISSGLLFTIGSKTKASTEQTVRTSDLLTQPFRRRFLKDKDKLRSIHASHEAKRSLRRQELQQERKKKQEANITMYRNYRIGDLPDVEIPYAAVLKPLQALAERDALVGRQLLVALFSGVLDELDGETGTSFTSQAAAAFGNILSKTTRCTPMLMAAILEIGLRYNPNIQLDPDSVSNVCRASGLLSLGCLLLEERLNVQSENSPPPAKRSRGQDDSQNCWLRLAELYQSLGEWDVVHGIFGQKLNCDDSVKEALRAEAEGNWRDAHLSYKKAIVGSDPDNQKDYYYEAFYKCLAHLSEWERLSVCIEDQLDRDLDAVWLDSWNQTKLLPWLFTSHLQLLGSRDGHAFWTTLQLWLADKEKMSHLSTHLSEELAMLFTVNQDFVRARLHMSQNQTSFLEDWAHMSPLSYKLRASALQNLQRASEIQMYLEFANTIDPQHYSIQTQQLRVTWNNNLPSATSPLLDWDLRRGYRKQFASQLEQKLGPNTAWLPEAQTNIHLAIIEASLAQNNFYIAKKYLRLNSELSESSDMATRLRYVLGYSKCKWLRSQQTPALPEKLKWMLDAWNVIEPTPADDCPMIWQQVSQYAQGIWQLLEENPETLGQIDEDAVMKLTGWMNAQNCSIATVKDTLRQHGLRSLQKAVALTEAKLNSDPGSKNSRAVADVYNRIAQYCRALCDDQYCPSDIVTAILRAMKYGSSEARQLFPCLLQIRHLGTEWADLFNKESESVPEWMFLGWVSQILASLDSSAGPALHNLVLRLARAYPKAVTYPFRLSREKYNLASDSAGLATKALLSRLEELLVGDTLMESFLRAISCLCQPEIILRYHVEKLITIAKMKTVDEHLNLAKNVMFEEVFPPQRRESKKASPLIQGDAFKALESYRKQVTSAIQQLSSGKVQAALTSLQNLSKQLSQSERKPSASLKAYSPWLSDFQAVQWSSELEIPGQYSGESRPLPQYHLKVAAFQEKVRIMPSIRRPIQITILGNDAKEHRYLVKFGEDLRQDQRIQQLFCLMNKILDGDSSCRHRQLTITTYQVVPLTSRVGMIQWMDDTNTLKDFMCDALKSDEKDCCLQANTIHNKWIEAATRGKCESYGQMYGNAYIKYSRIQTITAFQAKVNLVPWNILRRAFQNLSVSPESFFTLRHTFACSYAVMCIAHWLLGIGDRHAKNCLIQERDGRCLGIDFGHAFGTATQFLPVPELMPFRLTPHILNLLQPLQETGLLMETMVHCLKALRGGQQMLLATMEVFIQEPSMDWLDFAHKQQMKDSQAPSVSGEEEWFPVQKVRLAKQKLEGANPVSVTFEELKAGHKGNPKFLAKYLEVLRGEEQHNVRACEAACHLSPLEQVDCLLDLATDPNVLGKTWCGWDPWL